MPNARFATCFAGGVVLAALAWLAGETGLGQVVIRRPGPGLPIGLQPAPDAPAPTTPGTAAGYSSIKIVENEKKRGQLAGARDAIRDKDWKAAVNELQFLLDSPNDEYVQVRDQYTDARGFQQEIRRWTSIKFEANNLIGGMPTEGLEAYEVRVGAKAKELLELAKQNGDRELLAEVAQRYQHTRAGVEANELLATLLLARGQYFTAALRFERLLAMNSDHARLSPQTLFKASLALRRAGESAKAEEAWKRFEAATGSTGTLRIGDQQIALAKLADVLKDSVASDVANLFDWLRVRGDNSNTAQAMGSPPLLEDSLWRRPTMQDTIESDPQSPSEAIARQHIDDAIARAGNTAILPGNFPLATKNLMIYRTQRDLRAVFIKPGKYRDGSPYQAGDIAWRSLDFSGGLGSLFANPKIQGTLNNWMTQYRNLPAGSLNMLFENSLNGVISADHQYVYAVDDLALPPPFNLQMMANNPFMINNPQMQMYRVEDKGLQRLVNQNNLLAFDLQTGKLAWDLKDVGLFENSHFLGAPITVGGRLYVLNERNYQQEERGTGAQGASESDLRLVCIEPPQKVGEKPRVVEPVRSLGSVLPISRVLNDMSRRTCSVQMAYGEGMLVCPTNAGEIFGIDLMSQALVWSYPYREKEPSNQVRLTTENFRRIQPAIPMGASPANWKAAPPAISQGMVVFTAPDAHSVHCIQLRDGTPLWKAGQQEGDLFLAGVYASKALIVGKNRVRALNMADGQEAWSVTTSDLPSGQGVASKNIYYLPLKKGEILAIDLARGSIKARNRASSPQMFAGNLVFHDDVVLSQTVHAVSAFPQLSMPLEVARREADAAPNDLVKSSRYAELLLKDGQLPRAVEMLLKVHRQQPPGPLARTVRDRLYEGLTDLMLADFNAVADRYLREYESLTRVPEDADEAQRRRATYLRIVGHGREAQGNLVDAFTMYKDFGSLPLHRAAGGVVSLEDPSHKVPTNLWLRARIGAMMAAATPGQRDPLEKHIAKEWKVVEAQNNPEAIRAFVGMFDVPFRVGREARVRLAEIVMDRNDRSAYLEAELNLMQLLQPDSLRDRDTAGQALASLARLEEKKGTADSMQLAAAYYRQLQREYPKTKVRGSRTGEDLYDELATDKRFVPFLQEAGDPWGHAKLAARETPQSANPGALRGFVLQPAGDRTPFSQQHRLVIEPSNAGTPAVRLMDLANGKERWMTPLSSSSINTQLSHHLYQQMQMQMGYFPDAAYRFCHFKGHLLVAQVGSNAYCIDGDTGKKLWEEPLIQAEFNQPNALFQQVAADAEGNPNLILWNQFTNQRTSLPMGRIGAVEASYVALLTPKGLLVNDPLRGTNLWKKADVPLNSRVFGDDEHVFLIEGNDSGGLAAGRVFRAVDGSVVQAPDFTALYQHKVHLRGGRILAAVPTRQGLTLRYNDLARGKDLWTKSFPASATVLQSEDPEFAGVIEADGKMTVLNTQTGEQVMATSVLQGKISADALKDLKTPVLLADKERFYVALNQATPEVANPNRPNIIVNNGMFGVGSGTMSNFSNGIRCLRIHGWVLAIEREAGERRYPDITVKWKKGDLAWHSFKPVTDQMLVVEQFDRLPALIFSARYHELINGGLNGSRWRQATMVLRKYNGMLIYDPGPRDNNSMPQYFSFEVNQREGEVNLSGNSGLPSVQLYVEDGRPARQVNAAPARPGSVTVPTGLGLPFQLPVVVPPGGFGPRVQMPVPVEIEGR